MARFADVILPLPLPATFTYAVPDDWEGIVVPGSRVLVQFGKQGVNTGIVAAVHTNKPREFETKDILLPLDDTPILRNPQLKLWQWMADYYLCTPGDVMKAALPAALKVESETWVEVAIEPHEDIKLTDKQARIFDYLLLKGKSKISDVERKTKIKSARAIINTLLERGLLRIAEKTVDKYVSKKISVVTLQCERTDSEALHAFFELVGRSAKQEKALVAYLDMSGWLQQGRPLMQVEKQALVDRSGASPAVLKTMVDKGIFRIEKISVNRFAPDIGKPDMQLPTLSDAQTEALRSIGRNMREKQVTLLRGITGSGKTEIYAHLIKAALDHGDQVLYLVPEISLTTQLTTRLRKMFGDRLIVYHSKFSDNERVDIWRRLLSSHEPLLVLGVRSSIFLPFARLGLVVVDEEHESSYKQYDPAPRYNARDTAIMLAHMHGAKVLLGSATPSIETYYKAKTGKYGLVELLSRYADVQLPTVEVVDMRRQRKQKRNIGTFSDILITSLADQVKEKHQAIVFQNRRGYSPMLVCHECGWTPKCVNCDVSLVYHKHPGEMRCHYCGYTVPIPVVCPACGSNALSPAGYGTERIATELHELLPDASVTRMDLDSTRNKDSYEEIIEKFAAHKTDILVGTQMVSKGLDFENVSLVGIVNAETILNFPDFRSDERAFNMLEQVSGRAGRHKVCGRVLIQTVEPQNPVIAKVIAHDYEGFYDMEIKEREQYAYPPFTKIINIYLRAKDEHLLIELARDYVRALQQVFGRRVLGPEKPFVGRVSNYHIRSIMLKVESSASMIKVKHLLRDLYLRLAADPRSRQLLIHYDVDPA